MRYLPSQLACGLGAILMHGFSPLTAAVPAEIDLASDSAWTLSLDGGAPRAIQVPGGGWNSDQQVPRIDSMGGVKDFCTYERRITIPLEAREQVVKLLFGAVTYGCEVFLDGRKVGEHQGPQVAFEVDLTAAASPGKEQTLAVKVFHRRHYYRNGSCDVAVGWDFVSSSDPEFEKEAKRWCWWFGNSKVGYGICRSIKLVILPAVHIEGVFVRPSVEKKQLACDVWIRNTTNTGRSLRLESKLSSWNKGAWPYPAIPALDVTVAAAGVVKVTVGPVPWELGAASYWWPNIPFREDYVATLHNLHLKLTEGPRAWHECPQRFGFVEHAEGPYYYTVNGVRITGMSDATAEGQISHYDAYGASAAFLPPTKPGTGCPETWKRYQRIGINTNRTHCSPPTDYMMETADEAGFMLIPEAPIWGNGLSRFQPDATPQTVRDMGLQCRNHPCVARYSLTNEVAGPRDDKWPWRALIDAMLEVDDRHPLVFELNFPGSPQVAGLKRGHASVMEHYTDIHAKGGDFIRGMGEHFWTTDGMGDFAVGAGTLRGNDWCYFAPWSWINYWPNFLEGMNHELHAWKVNNHTDRTDKVDGWDSPVVRFVQHRLHPYLVMDQEIETLNPAYSPDWPKHQPVLPAGSEVTRRIEVFNGGLLGNRMALKWQTRWDSPQGDPVADGRQDFVVEPGFHTTRTIAFKAPPADRPRTLVLLVESLLDQKSVFTEDKLRYQIKPAE